jgi:uncharacterized protein (DUF1778 family)
MTLGHKAMKNPKRTTLLINCSVEEAKQVRAAAKRQERTISAYILRAVRRSLDVEQQIEKQRRFLESQAAALNLGRR